MNCSEGLNNVQISRPNYSSPDVERQLRILKGELKNLRQSLVDNLALNGVDENMPILCLLALHKCDPVYKYPSFDFIRMLLYCAAVRAFVTLSFILIFEL